MKSNYKIKIHVSNSSIIYLCLVFAVIAENECFRLFKIDTGFLKILKLLLLGIAFLLVVFTNNIRKIELQGLRFLYKYLFIIVVFLLGQYIYTKQMYHSQNLLDFFRVAQGYLYLIMLIPLFYLFQSDIGLEKVLDSFKILVFITLLIMIVNAYFYNTRGVNIIPINYYTELMRRNNRLRVLDLSSMEGMAIIWTFYELLYRKRHKCLNSVILLVSFGALIYVEQARVIQISILMSLAIMYILKADRRRNAILMKIACICLVGGYSVLSGQIGEVIRSFSANGAYGSSTTIRLDEVRHAIQLISKYYINGVGLVSKYIGNYFSSYAGRGQFGLTDIGILGLLTQIGLWVIPVYLYPMFRFFNILCKTKNDSDQYYYPFLIGLFSYLLMTSATIIIINQQRIYAWPMVICIFEYSYSIYKAEGGT